MVRIQNSEEKDIEETNIKKIKQGRGIKYNKEEKEKVKKINI